MQQKMEKVKYYYIDSKGNKKRYRGQIEEKDGKLFGTLISHKTTNKIAELVKKSEGLKEVKGDTYLVWKDREGIEYKLTDNDKVINNKVQKQYKDKILLEFHPEQEKKIWFTYYDKSLKKQVVYEGEVFEENGKYYGEREII